MKSVGMATFSGWSDASVQNVFRLSRSTRGEAPQVTRKHRVVVEPTVIVRDDSGAETARFEGEDSRTIEAIGSALAHLTRTGK